jgi:nitronate monooxygenase/enoyl-[acyl-carrier protein] reductase II
VVSFHLAVPADLIARAHDAGIVWLQQVVDVYQAEEAAAAGADVIIAQGGEGGGNGGFVSTMVLVPQVVDIAGEIPVAAAGGIADGRGLAAALALGAQGGAWAPASSPRPRWPSPANGSSVSSTPTRSTPSR